MHAIYGDLVQKEREAEGLKNLGPGNENAGAPWWMETENKHGDEVEMKFQMDAELTRGPGGMCTEPLFTLLYPI